jgi:hypothetical protein
LNAATDFAEQKFLIIAGTSKAGTTSVFNYLAKHPEICATEVKETRFFLDIDYPLQSERRYERDGAAAYLSFFADAAGKSCSGWKMEATPDYLYSPGTAQLIRKTLPNVRLIFLLRAPASRLISFYQFGQTMGVVSQSMTFDQFVEHQLENAGGCPEGRNPHPAFRALPDGCYSTYLRPFVELFGKSSLHVAFYEDLVRAPLELVKGLCRFAQIDEQCLDGYSFKVVNKGVSVRSTSLHNAYWRTKQKIRSRLRSAPGARSLLRKLGRRLDAIYDRTNVTARDGISISPSTRKVITDYYREEPARLQELLGVEAPWPTPAESLQRL